ncbi:hypothetical protein ACQ9BH_24835 [Escherichia coli]|jgi:hypothetical protein|uniref:hypothetical protein n=1 Tax=Escherichia coli TaxID=562 RepID=UPI0010CBDC7F|nr:hypothetical protein [Escherichia coli]EFV8312163.1 hypothetical protein [Shigella sonnei]HDS3440455.1 hypothetical protein [Escherichia coli O157]EFJ2690064.1 hypothetical protein [Escherichia coli]EIS3455222.1 hypothetical protein [Escherichia coli]EJD7390501.1 hypothetical protein [Escherichia coli]
MAMTGAERQRKYRQLCASRSDARLNMFISRNAGDALELLTAHYGMSKREVLEFILCMEAESLNLSGDIDDGDDDYDETGTAERLEN